MRPRFIWLLSLLCAAGIFGAMAVITHRSLQLERDNALGRSDAELQGRIRLALWRMETEASTLVLAENIRPPEQFHAFLGAGTSARPSPLAGFHQPDVQLHFEIGAGGEIVSPQAPAGEQRLKAIRAGIAPADLDAAGTRLAQLRTLLASRPDLNWSRGVVSFGTKQAQVSWSNRTLLAAAAAAPPQQVAPESPPFKALPISQTLQNDNELSRRAQASSKLLASNTVPTRKFRDEKPMKDMLELKKKAETARVPGIVTEEPAFGKAAAGRIAAAAPAPAPAPAAKVAPPALLMADSSYGLAAPGAPFAGAADVQLDAAGPAGEAGQASPFRPFWLGAELFLVREVVSGGTRLVQGVWLNAPVLRASLLNTVSDILARAALEPVQGIAFVSAAPGQLRPTEPKPVADPMSLVGLPWRLVPHERPVAVITGITPVRFMLVAAWSAAVLAAAAASALLFGVTRLSERRAAFVSSVTHELRTPLTTFRLYSEMLEQGMVGDEAQRSHYLRTLRTEAERLTHLVDNVLAYSRIERARRHARREHLELPGWLERVTPRFAERARECGMSLDARVQPAALSLVSETDATALEQILFNLIDNACKYAAGRCVEPVVRLTLDKCGRWAEWRVCDTGPGIPRRERARLFRPFHKSADEAANSKPGVGLGLALSKRLARALGGDLSLVKGEEAGACFVLRIPCE